MVTPVKAQDTPGLGPYRLLRQLADGGVFLAERPGGQPAVAWAIAGRRAADPQFRAEVGGDPRGQSGSPPPVVDADLDNAAPWLAMAYVTGPSLAETVREQGPLPVLTVLGLAAGLAEGLRDMYAVGLVHRNLRPSNVVLTQDGPRLTGFGTWNATDVPGMDPGFLSPEQVLADDVGSAGDIFSLGAVLAFAATGHGPFGSGSSAALMYRLVNSPAQLDDIGAELRTVVASCLEKRPGDRPTASDLLAVLAAIRPQGAGRSWWQAAARFHGGHPQAAGSAAPPPALASGSAGGRRRRPRLLTPVLVTASLLAAVVVGVLALTGTLFPGGGRAHRAAGGNHRGGRWPRFAGGWRLGAFKGPGRGARLVPGLGGLGTFGALGWRHAVDAGRFDHGRTGKPALLGGRTAELSGAGPAGSVPGPGQPRRPSRRRHQRRRRPPPPRPQLPRRPRPLQPRPRRPLGPRRRRLLRRRPRAPSSAAPVVRRPVVRGTVVRRTVVCRTVVRRTVVRRTVVRGTVVCRTVVRATGG